MTKRKITLDDVNQYFIDQGIHTYSEVLQILSDTDDELERLEEKRHQVTAEAWWRGVNDQWKHRPIGNRMLESKNPYKEDK